MGPARERGTTTRVVEKTKATRRKTKGYAEKIKATKSPSQTHPQQSSHLNKPRP